MVNYPKVSIIGCGQVGSVLSRYFIQENFRVSVFESPYRMNFSQHPWGWMRRVTLQQEARIKRPLQKLDIFKKHQIHGPMIISTSSIHRYEKWKLWLNRTRDTNARILSKEEALEKYQKTEPFNLLCDTRDFLFDFGAYRDDLVEDIRNDAERFTMKNISKLEWSNNKVISMIDDESTRYTLEEDEKILLCVGNQTRRFIKVPTIGIRLGYSVAENFKPHLEPPYIASWNDNSSVQYFPNYTKVGCGMIGNLDYLPPFPFWPRFLSLLQKPNYYSFQSLENQVKIACNEVHVPYTNTNSCTIDISPNFLPMILPIGDNLTVVCGMSGSGFTVYESWFQDLVKKILLDKNYTQHYFNGKNYVSIPAESYLY
jgi:hypothetical protein